MQDTLKLVRDVDSSQMSNWRLLHIVLYVWEIPPTRGWSDACRVAAANLADARIELPLPFGRRLSVSSEPGLALRIDPREKQR